MGHGTRSRRANLIRILPQGAARERHRRRLPRLGTLLQLVRVELDIEGAFPGVKRNHVAVADERDGAAERGLRADMTDAKPTRGAGEAAVGDERHLVAHALAVKRRGRRQHLAHAGAAFGALVADDDDVAFFVALGADGGEGVLLAIEKEGGAEEFQYLHTGQFDVVAVGREVYLEHSV